MVLVAAMSGGCSNTVCEDATSKLVASAREPEVTDHQHVVGRIGLSWLGVSNIPLATGAPGGTEANPVVLPGPPTSVAAPALGIRYWLTGLFGIEAQLRLCPF